MLQYMCKMLQNLKGPQCLENLIPLNDGLLTPVNRDREVQCKVAFS